MADRVGVISRGELIVVDEKSSLMAKLGKKTLTSSRRGIAERLLRALRLER